jgi:uncharacterized protein (TIGR04255 family)
MGLRHSELPRIQGNGDVHSDCDGPYEMKKSTPKVKRRAKFKSPPINELVIALYHLPIVEMKAQHIGLYWDKIRARYPNCDQQPPISLTPNFPEVPGEIFPLPRFWFHSGPASTLIQVQRDAFMFNWRKGSENAYPHYEAVRKQFCKELDTYQSFLQATFNQKIDVVNRCELTYINIITQNEVWRTPSDIGKLFPTLATLVALPGTSRPLAGINSSFTYRFGDNLLVDSAVKLGKRIDTSEDVAVLEIKASGAPEGLSINSIHACLDAAHDATHEMFLNFTAKNVQKTIWKQV